MELQGLDDLIDHLLGISGVHASDLDARGEGDLHVVRARRVEFLAHRPWWRQAVAWAEQFVTEPGAGFTAKQATNRATNSGADAGENHCPDRRAGRGSCPSATGCTQAAADGFCIAIADALHAFFSAGVMPVGKVDDAAEVSNEMMVGDRIAQAMLIPVPVVTFEEVDSLSESERGTGGFGSSGK